MNKVLNRLRELDVLRGFAALLVLFFHLTMGREQAGLGFKLGTTGVDLFFIISGFVISVSIYGVSSGIEFVINRTSRLYPTYWASVTFTFLMIAAYALYKGDAVPILQYAGNMTMFQYYQNIPNLDEPYWTMIIEMNFYFFIWVLFQGNLLRFIIPIGVSITLFVLIVTYFFWNEFFQNLFTAIPLLIFFPLFFAGIIFYKLYTEGKSNGWLNLLLLLLCLATQIFLYNFAGRSRSFVSHFEYGCMLTLYFGLFLLFTNNKLKFIVNKPLLFFGKISFALYLTHQYLLLAHLLPLLVNRLGLNFWIASIGICLPISVFVASLITYFIEIPYSMKMKKWLKAKLITI